MWDSERYLSCKAKTLRSKRNRDSLDCIMITIVVLNYWDSKIKDILPIKILLYLYIFKSLTIWALSVRMKYSLQKKKNMMQKDLLRVANGRICVKVAPGPLEIWDCIISYNILDWDRKKYKSETYFKGFQDSEIHLEVSTTLIM